MKRFHSTITIRSREYPRTLLLLLLFLPLPAIHASEPTEERAFFSKTFPKGTPPYFQVVLRSTGEITYSEDAKGADPTEFETNTEKVPEVFEILTKLSNAEIKVASSRKVAFTGEKLLRFRGPGGQWYETRFNYTEDKDTRTLLSWFERVGETARHRRELERVAQFDRLGVNHSLLIFQIAFEKKRIIAPMQFLPILNKISSGKKYIHIARSRAASLVERIKRKPEQQ